MRVKAKASPEQVRELIKHTDRIAEIHNTIRKGVEITLED